MPGRMHRRIDEEGMHAYGWGREAARTTCADVQRAKAYLVANGRTLSTEGGRLLDRVLALGPRFTFDQVAGPGADSVVRDGAACLIEFLCEVGVLRAIGPSGTYVRSSSEPVEGTVSCVVCGGEWLIGSGALPSLPRAICLAPSFLVVLHTLRVVGICPACRAT